MNQIDLEQKIVIGRFGSSFGVKGWIKVQSFSEPEENLFTYTDWYWQGPKGWQKLCHDAHNAHGNGWVVHLDGFDTPETVRLLAGQDIAVLRQEFAPLEGHEFYLQDLIGFAVVTVTDQVLGSVQGFVDSGAHELLVVTGEKEYLIPLIKDIFVKNVLLTERKIIVDWDADFQ